MALKMNPWSHVEDSNLFQGFGGSLEDFGNALGHYGFTKQAFLFAAEIHEDY